MNADLLHLPLIEIGFSEQFCNCSDIMGFTTLKEIVDTPTDKLLRKKAFNYKWLGELTEVLIRHGQIALLQSIPEKNHD